MRQPQKPSIRCFRRWKRKPYAAFASLGKVIKIGVICVACSLIVMRAQPTLAQSVPGVIAKDTLRQLDEVSVTAERPPRFRSLMHVVAVISRSDIERAAVQNLSDLLRYVEGVDIRARSPQNVQADISLRGGTFDQTVILLNGVNITDPQTGHHSLNIPVNLENVARIEVLQGPGAWTFGASAYSGAINIVTGLADTSGITVGMAQGMHKYQNYHAGGMIAAKNVRAAVSADKSMSDGFTANTGFDIDNVFAQLRYILPHGAVNGQFGYQNKDFGANNFYGPEYPTQYEHTRTFLSSLQYRIDKRRWSAAATVYHRQHQDRYELFRSNPASWYAGPNYHRTDAAGALLQLDYVGKFGTTTAGMNVRYEHIYSNNLGEPLAAPVAVKGEDAFYTLGKSRRHLSGFLRHTLHLRKFHVTLGLMGAGNNAFGFRLYAGGNLAYDFTPRWQLNAAASNSYRLPTFTDLYYHAGNQRGTVDLKPEEAINGELSLRYRNGFWSAALLGFFRYGYQTISWVKKDDHLWYAENIVDIATCGGHLQVAYAPQQRFLKKAAVHYAYLYADPKLDESVSYTIEQMSHQFTGTLQHGIWRQLAASWQLSYRQRAGTYEPYDAATGLRSAPVAFAPFWLCDLKIYWDAAHYTLFVEATNLFDRHYCDFGNIPQPGRWVKAGITVKI
jgi:iron complex outermembrane receptor protein